MNSLNYKEYNDMQKHFESLGEYIYKFSKGKKRACVFVLNSKDDVFLQRCCHFRAAFTNLNLQYEDIKFVEDDNFENLKKIYDFILILDISYNYKKRIVKIKKIDNNTLKAIYFVTGDKMTWDDFHIMEGYFCNNLYTSERIELSRKIINKTIVSESTHRYTLKEKYSYFESPENRSILLS